MQTSAQVADPFVTLKEAQKQGWGAFIPLEAVTTAPAGELVKFARIAAGQKVLDVGTGTGVVAITAARAGAEVSGLDLSPRLLERARVNNRLAGTDVAFIEGDAEALPYPDASFDAVLSQFGHMFAPRAEVAIREMLRVLKPGGRIAFSTWPPEHFVGRMFSMVSRYVPPPAGISSPPQWGDANVVRERLGSSVVDLVFDRGLMSFPALSPAHYRESVESTLAPVIKLVQSAQSDPTQLGQFRQELEQLVSEHMEGNIVRQHYLMTRATKRDFGTH